MGDLPLVVQEIARRLQIDESATFVAVPQACEFATCRHQTQFGSEEHVTRLQHWDAPLVHTSVYIGLCACGVVYYWIHKYGGT